jgi:dTDP-glucose 4,6-dehydratase
VVRHLVLVQEESVVNVDKLTYAGSDAATEAVRDHERYAFEQVDICDGAAIERIFEAYQPTAVLHLAAESHVDRSIAGPDAFVDTNVTGTHELLKAARQVWPETGSAATDVRFHHISTDEVYGSLGPADPRFTETSPYAPNSPYAATKAAADHLVRAYHHTYGLPVTTSNCSNNYGPLQFPEKLIPLVLVNLLEGKRLPVYGDGLNVRDWLYVEDHCRAIERVIEAGRVGETYNVGGRNEWTNIDIIRLLCRLVGEVFAGDRTLAARFPRSPAAAGRSGEELITFVKDRPGHDRRYAIDASKIERELNFFPQESFETGIRKTLNWYLANEAWWRAVMDGSYRDWVRQQYDEAGR